ncbi:MAG: DUF1173 domain-containing protein [Hydrogenophaga sp.]|uniref:DUF1173 domain-containing protein n=1 Tax=Hydrogenophaga sp. TaxID=1904254 RepID=UPI003D150958
MDSPPVPVPAYQIGGQRWDRTMPDFPEAIAKAHAHHLRPRCLCRPYAPGVEMYVARLSDGYVIKRMPNTGWQHTTDCPSYEPPAEFSGLGPLVGSAIVENPVTGVTALRLDFPMTKLPGRHVQPAAGNASSSVASQGQKLGLRALLHYLWDQAELTHWKPGFVGRRHWATVRRHLLQAAENKATQGQPLQASLYIPEVFSVEQRDAIQARRQRQWARATPRPGQPQPLMLMVAEVKEIAPSRYGHTATLKHIPDQAFTLDEALYRRMGRCFERELTLWGTEADLHLIVMATFRLDEAGAPALVEMTLMLATAQWLPVEDAWERQLINALVRHRRSFAKGLRYNAPPDQVLAAASLLDCGTAPYPLFIDRDHSHGDAPTPGFATLGTDGNPPAWRWLPVDGDMPALPPQQLWHPATPLP